jgi:tetratricopeptide (TPR) repeat protein
MPRRPKRPPPPPNEELFGEVVCALRESVGEGRTLFADRFGKSRSYISGIENEHWVPKTMRDWLIRDFPDSKQRIEEAYKRSQQLRQAKKKTQSTRDPFRQRIERWIAAGQFGFARAGLREKLKQATEPELIHWLYEHLATVYMSLDEDDRAVEALQATVDYAVKAGLKDDELASRIRLATYHQRRDNCQRAHEVLDDGLRRFPTAADLWLRKGKVHWQEQDHSPAYAALMTAEVYGGSHPAIIHARGQVLTEWGAYEAALRTWRSI